MDISWKITPMETAYCHTIRMQPKPMGTVKPEKASWSQQFVFNAKHVQITMVINSGDFKGPDSGFGPKPRSPRTCKDLKSSLNLKGIF